MEIAAWRGGLLQITLAVEFESLLLASVVRELFVRNWTLRDEVLWAVDGQHDLQNVYDFSGMA